jgi:hypothetical protein
MIRLKLDERHHKIVMSPGLEKIPSAQEVVSTMIFVLIVALDIRFNLTLSKVLLLSFPLLLSPTGATLSRAVRSASHVSQQK